MFSVLKQNDLAIFALLYVHCEMRNEKQLLSFTSSQRNDKCCRQLAEAVLLLRNLMQSLCCGYAPMLCHYFIKSQSSHIMWARENGERDAAIFFVGVSVTLFVLFFGTDCAKPFTEM